MSDHILGYMQDGCFRVENDFSDVASFGFDDWMVYDVRTGTNNPVKRGITGIAAAFSEARKLNRGNLSRYEVRPQPVDAYSDRDVYCIFDMWYGRDPYGFLVKTFNTREKADRICRRMNTDDDWMDADPNRYDS